MRVRTAIGREGAGEIDVWSLEYRDYRDGAGEL